MLLKLDKKKRQNNLWNVNYIFKGVTFSVFQCNPKAKGYRPFCIDSVLELFRDSINCSKRYYKSFQEIDPPKFLQCF